MTEIKENLESAVVHLLDDNIVKFSSIIDDLLQAKVSDYVDAKREEIARETYDFAGKDADDGEESDDEEEVVEEETEEVESIDEISKELRNRYANAAANSESGAHREFSRDGGNKLAANATIGKRQRGRFQAWLKNGHGAKVNATESVDIEDLEELSRHGILSRYIKRTNDDDSRWKGNKLAMKKKWGDMKKYGIPEPNVKGTNEEVELEEAMKLIKTHTSASGNKEAKVYKDTEWGEFRVKHYTGGKHHANADYHTDDVDDAHGTAKQHIKEDVAINEVKHVTLDDIEKEAHSHSKTHFISVGPLEVHHDGEKFHYKVDRKKVSRLGAQKHLSKFTGAFKEETEVQEDVSDRAKAFQRYRNASSTKSSDDLVKDHLANGGGVKKLPTISMDPALKYKKRVTPATVNRDGLKDPVSVASAARKKEIEKARGSLKGSAWLASKGITMTAKEEVEFDNTEEVNEISKKSTLASLKRGAEKNTWKPEWAKKTKTPAKDSEKK